MLMKKKTILSTIMACMIAFPAINVSGATTTTSSSTSSTTTQATTVTTGSAVSVSTATTASAATSVKITDFGAHSITETGYSSFDSSSAINKAIQYAKTNNISKVDFGSGKYYATAIQLESNITYSSTQDAELIASPSTKVWAGILESKNKTMITIEGLTLNGNKTVVPGDDSKGSQLIVLSTSNNITIQGCTLYNNWSAGILMKDNCNYIAIKNNNIDDTDVGIGTMGNPSNNITIDNNNISGGEKRLSEGISIYTSNSGELAHDINITNNIIYNKLSSSGILVLNSKRVLIQGNHAYNCSVGINVGFDNGKLNSLITVSSDITIDNNEVYNCTQGIVGEMSNSTISKNQVHDIKGLGIQLKTQNTSTLISGDTITGNTVTNVDSSCNSEPPIRLISTSQCKVDNNIVADTRTPVLHVNAIAITGTNCTDNIVQNNTSLGKTKSGYQIYISTVKNTTLKNNIAKVLNYGTNTTLQNNTGDICDLGTGTVIQK